MEWVKPEILWGLAALIIPVLIHLLHLRRFRKVAFSNVAFLADVKKETRSKHRLRNLLILALRLIAVAALVAAFADPYIPYSETNDNGSGVGNAISIYLDTSPSIDAIGEEGPLLQLSKTRASEIVENYSETDKFHIITNSFAGKDSHFLSKDEALERIATVQSEPFVRNIESVISRSSDQLNKATNRKRTMYLMSDLQKNSHSFSESFKPDTNISLLFIPSLANERPNVWIDSAWFNAPIATAGKSALLNVRIKHNAMQRIDGLGLQLHIQGERTAITTFHLEPGLATDTVLRFSHGNPGINHAVLSIDDAPIKFDDTYFLGYEIVDQINIVHLTPDLHSNETKSIDNVFRSVKDFVKIETSESLPDDVTLSTYDLIIANGIEEPTSGLIQSLKNFAMKGGSVVIIPDSSNLSRKAHSLRTEMGFGSGVAWSISESPEAVGNLRFNHPFFEGMFSSIPTRMDMPSTDRCIIRDITPNEEILAFTNAGLPFLSKIDVGTGGAFLFGSPLAKETGNLVNHALFVPLLLRMSEVARSAKVEAITLGRENSISLDFETKTEDHIIISAINGEIVIIPESRSAGGSTRLLLGPKIENPGNYFVEVEGVSVLAFGVNADRTESDPTAWDVPGFKEQLTSYGWGNSMVLSLNHETIASVIGNLETGNHFWWYLIIVVILALACETIIQKRWKVI
ncbi:MAG TPA: hypothetical protein EYN28_05965 [Flavobacteriales bacterium]|jgi:hypothetical protein|nr:hypothetical protein [Flavobacteriales bacterium]HHZ96358.1 hypothetical protein [Flavobacteriales bacterium]HIB76197.1 hypothetical protein [Flavobacteriales bacterium]HIO59704.1 hypothetical protein [Flavobacteriales bacterium]